MIGSILSGVVALAAVAGAVFAFVRALDAERRCADARVNDATKAGALAIADTEVRSLRAAVAAWERKAHALDKVLDEVATDGDAAGARSRVLARLEREAGADPAGSSGDDSDAMHQPAAAEVAPQPSAAGSHPGP